MKSIEDALVALEKAFRESYPTYLAEQEAKWKDGIRLEPFRTIEWQEVAQIPVAPAIILMGDDESDPNLRDQLFDATVTAYIVVMDKAKTYAVKKLYRYVSALRLMLRDTRTLGGIIVSAKLVRAQYSPIFTERTNLYARDCQVTLQLRIPRE